MIKKILVILIVLIFIISLFKAPKFFKVPKWLERYAKFNAITLPPFGMFFVGENFVESTIKHELIHWEQYKKFGVLGFYFIYLLYSIKYGYWDNPLEIEAYESEK